MGANALTLFNMEHLSSVTAMVLAVNLITQVIKEIFLRETVNQRIPKFITLLAATLVVAVHHNRIWVESPGVFHHSIIELVFFIFINGIFIAALSMGNYKVLNLTKDKEVKKMKEELAIKEAKLQYNEKYQEDGELF
ncbi:hypothetical protein FQB35_12720 [Crassaminicella thermophila]|uniref:Uncharacterized protein n=1 Tax=Crassaminicella thermophila TaxID=2599308 RepID=A0A5C0SGM3_CRATE|nr:hypothetical protein [Crassaminicella thermophila]QEK13112.1 hypothetical protein FQB35_12720 [Crassaminicella thermophila]